MCISNDKSDFVGPIKPVSKHVHGMKVQVKSNGLCWIPMGSSVIYNYQPTLFQKHQPSFSQQAPSPKPILLILLLSTLTPGLLNSTIHKRLIFSLILSTICQHQPASNIQMFVRLLPTLLKQSLRLTQRITISLNLRRKSCAGTIAWVILE